MGLSLFVLANIVIFTALIWWNAASLEPHGPRAPAGGAAPGRPVHGLAASWRSRRGSTTPCPRSCEAICESLGWAVGALWRVDPEADVLRCGDVWHSPSSAVEEFVALSRRTTFAPGVGLPGRVWASGQPAWIPDVVPDANFPRARAAAREGLHGAFGFPIVVGSDILGVVEVFSGEIQQPDDDLLQMLDGHRQPDRPVHQAQAGRGGGPPGALPAQLADGHRPGLDLLQGHREPLPPHQQGPGQPARPGRPRRGGGQDGLRLLHRGARPPGPGGRAGHHGDRAARRRQGGEGDVGRRQRRVGLHDQDAVAGRGGPDRRHVRQSPATSPRGSGPRRPCARGRNGSGP